MIDILLSTYNGEKYLNELLDSLLAQTYTNWVLFIRDDGSSDNTISIIDKYCQAYPQKIRKISEKNGVNVGVIHSFELLLKESQSEYIMFCDQDDIWLPHKIEDALEEISSAELQQPNKPIVICSDLYVVDNQLNKISESFWSYCRMNPSLLQKNNELAINNYVTGCTMLFNRKAKQISLPFGKNAVMHDAWIALKVLASNGIIIILEKPEILYRQHQQNKLGAIAVQYCFRYFFEKILNIKRVFEKNYLNYKQANEVLGMSFGCFIYYRLVYLIRR